MSDRLSFYSLYQFGTVLYDVLLGLQDFFFQPRVFNLHLSTFFDVIFKIFGFELTVYEGSVANFIIGYGLALLLGIRLLKFFLDILF